MRSFILSVSMDMFPPYLHVFRADKCIFQSFFGEGVIAQKKGICEVAAANVCELQEITNVKSMATLSLLVTRYKMETLTVWTQKDLLNWTSANVFLKFTEHKEQKWSDVSSLSSNSCCSSCIWSHISQLYALGLNVCWVCHASFIPGQISYICYSFVSQRLACFCFVFSSLSAIWLAYIGNIFMPRELV